MSEKFFRKTDWIACWTTFVLSLIVYTLTLQPTVGLEDSGELIVASDYLGVPHPPGYPSWTLLTWLSQRIFHFVHFHGHPNPAWGVNFLSAFAAAAACGTIALLISRSGRDIVHGLTKKHESLSENAISMFCSVAGIVGGLLLAFGHGMWSQAVIAEVYTLNVFFEALTLVFLYRWMAHPEERKWLIASSFTIALGFTNHQTVVFLGAALAIAVLFRDQKLFRDFAIIGLILIAFFMLQKKTTDGKIDQTIEQIQELNKRIPNSTLLTERKQLAEEQTDLLAQLAKLNEATWYTGPSHSGFWTFVIPMFFIPILIAIRINWKGILLISIGFILLFVGIDQHAKHTAQEADKAYTTKTEQPKDQMDYKTQRERAQDMRISTMEIGVDTQDGKKPYTFKGFECPPFLMSVCFLVAVPLLLALRLPHGRMVCLTILTIEAGLLFYMYMPLSSDQNPPINWGYPRTWDGFVHAFSRKQYAEVVTLRPLTETGHFINALGYFINNLRSQYLPLVLAGLLPFSAWRMKRFNAAYLGIALFLIAASLMTLSTLASSNILGTPEMAEALDQWAQPFTIILSLLSCVGLGIFICNFIENCMEKTIQLCTGKIRKFWDGIAVIMIGFVGLVLLAILTFFASKLMTYMEQPPWMSLAIFEAGLLPVTIIIGLIYFKSRKLLETMDPPSHQRWVLPALVTSSAVILIQLTVTLRTISSLTASYAPNIRLGSILERGADISYSGFLFSIALGFVALLAITIAYCKDEFLRFFGEGKRTVWEVIRLIATITATCSLLGALGYAEYYFLNYTSDEIDETWKSFLYYTAALLLDVVLVCLVILKIKGKTWLQKNPLPIGPCWFKNTASILLGFSLLLFAGILLSIGRLEELKIINLKDGILGLILLEVLPSTVTVAIFAYFMVGVGLFIAKTVAPHIPCENHKEASPINRVSVVGIILIAIAGFVDYFLFKLLLTSKPLPLWMNLTICFSILAPPTFIIGAFFLKRWEKTRLEFTLNPMGQHWLMTTTVAYIAVGIVFLYFQNPKLDMQSLFIQHVQYLLSHAVYILWISYGLLLIMTEASVALKNRFSARLAIVAGMLLLPILLIAKNAKDENQHLAYGRADQGGHDYGWQYGNWQLRGVEGIKEDLQTYYPNKAEFDKIWAEYPNKNYPEPMGPNAIFFGGTDPGRFVPTYMIYSAHVRPDVYLITQNALADDTYMKVMRDLYGDQIWIPDAKALNDSFLEYRTRYGGGNALGGKMEVKGTDAVMKVNGILTEMIFRNNQFITEGKTNEETRPSGAAVVYNDPPQGAEQQRSFYIEESSPLPWMYPYLSPNGLIMKINSEPTLITDEMIKNDVEFWNWYTKRLLSDGKFRKDLPAQKSFSKLRSSIAGLYRNNPRQIYSIWNDEIVEKASKMEKIQQQLEQSKNQLAKLKSFAAPKADKLKALTEEVNMLQTQLNTLRTETVARKQELKALEQKINYFDAVAENAYRQALELYFLSSETNYYLARIMAMQGRFNEAIELIDSILKVDPNHSLKIQQHLGMSLRFQRDLNTIEVFHTLKKDTLAQNWAQSSGALKTQMKPLHQTIENILSEVTPEKTNRIAKQWTYALETIHIQMGKQQRDLNMIRSALAHSAKTREDSNAKQFLSSLETIHTQMNNVLQDLRAIQSHLAANEITETDSTLANSCIESLEAIHNQMTSIEILPSVLKILQSEAETLAESWIDQLKVTPAKMALMQKESIETLKALNAGMANSLAILLTQQKRYALAEAAQQRNLDLAPDNVKNWINLAALQLHQNKLDEMWNSMEKAIKLKAKIARTQLKSDPRFSSLRTNPRFQKLTTPPQSTFGQTTGGSLF